MRPRPAPLPRPLRTSAFATVVRTVAWLPAIASLTECVVARPSSPSNGKAPMSHDAIDQKEEPALYTSLVDAEAAIDADPAKAEAALRTVLASIHESDHARTVERLTWRARADLGLSLRKQGRMVDVLAEMVTPVPIHGWTEAGLLCERKSDLHAACEELVGALHDQYPNIVVTESGSDGLRAKVAQLDKTTVLDDLVSVETMSLFSHVAAQHPGLVLQRVHFAAPPASTTGALKIVGHTTSVMGDECKDVGKGAIEIQSNVPGSGGALLTTDQIQYTVERCKRAKTTFQGATVLVTVPADEARAIKGARAELDWVIFDSRAVKQHGTTWDLGAAHVFVAP